MPHPDPGQWKTPIFAFCCGLAATFLICRAFNRAEAEKFQIRFESCARSLAHEIDNRVRTHERMLIAGRGLFEASPNVERAAWRTFTGCLDFERQPGAMALGMIRHVPPHALAPFLNTTRADHAPGFIPRELRAGGPHYIVEHIHPESGNENALGLDISAEPRHREAAECAADQGRTVMTRPVRLRGNAADPAGVILLHPVYRKTSAATPPEARRATLVGWLYAAIRIDTLTSGLPAENLRFELVENHAGPGETLVAPTGRFTPVWRNVVADGHWILACAPDSEAPYATGALVILPLGLLCSVFLAIMIHALRRTRVRAESLAATMTADLKKRGEELELALTEKESALTEARAASVAKSAFLANMSHEIRTPMNAILGYAQLLRRDTALDARHQEQLAIINRAGEHLLAIINDILEMSKIEAGGVTVTPTDFDLRHLLDTLVELCAERAHRKGLTLAVRLDSDVPAIIRCDEPKLRQTLLNIIGNAVKFTRTGGVTVSVSAELTPTGDHLLSFAVSDTGPGIAPGELAQLFHPFSQTKTGATTAGGTGLGLAIGKHHAALLGGDIRVTSAPGVGSTFTLTVRAEPGRLTPRHASAARPRPLRIADAENHPGLLIAEDNPQSRELLSDILGPAGFDLTLTNNGAEAVAAFDPARHRAVILDIMMPVMDGKEAARRIRKLPSGGDVPILAITASVFEENKTEVLAAGVTDFMRKPFDQECLLTWLGARLGLRYLYAGTPSDPRPADTEPSTLTLPEPLRQQLLAACISADYERLMELGDALASTHPDAAASIRRRAGRFDYDGIERLLGAPPGP